MDKVKYYISDDNAFIIENYNSSATFSSFFPGIAGLYGTPMWVFYANRGQCISSFGIQDKNGEMMEFLPANKTYQMVALHGFRTFLKVNGKFHEPFSERSEKKSEMRITPYDLTIKEENKELGLTVEVNYFTLPNEKFPALVRTLKVTNKSSSNKKIEVIDGMPALIPCGFADSLLKNMSQTTQAWSTVKNLENDAPFFKLKVTPADIAETRVIEEGNFLVSFVDQGGKTSPTRIIVNTKAVFDEVTSMEFPKNFIRKDFVVPDIQVAEGFIPSAFSHKALSVPAKSSFELISIIGRIESVDALNAVKKRISSKKFIEIKAEQNRRLIEEIISLIDTKSSSKSFDLYSRQTFLDNVMRGGLPITLGNKCFYAYYRKHGDMERDYNDFKLLPTYFSQGNGNYRDVNQNRRYDVFFNPDVAEYNIVRFMNLVQLDGFNPLVVLGSKYFVEDEGAAAGLVKEHLNNEMAGLKDVILQPFVLGDLLRMMENAGASFKTSREEFLQSLMRKSSRAEEADHGEGYWTDHFSYNIDLLESFEYIYPDRINGILFNEKIFTYFDNDHIVADRIDKYHNFNGKIRQYKSIAEDEEKGDAIYGRSRDRHLMRTNFGKDGIYRTTLISKLLCIAVNKAASFDAEGIGIEMEADKPDWYDALNGLPGLFGSSLSETLEIKRLCVYVLDRMHNDLTVDVPVEIKEFMDAVRAELGSGDSFKYWDSTYTAKEIYRDKTLMGISGEEAKVDAAYISDFLGGMIRKCDAGIKKCLERYGSYQTYFINEVTGFENVEKIGVKGIKVTGFTQKPMPLFLEGFVHALRVEKNKDIYGLVRKSPLFDKKLKMYKVNASLDSTTIEIGRAKVFTPGWLENESVWLHMEYKYMLELLKAGMYKEFFSDLKDVLVPFMDPDVYQRSILENSSFIASSAYPVTERHGRGFVARLSGATAEFIEMWIKMMAGTKLFFLGKDGKLNFQLSPILPSWMFNKGELTFKLLGTIEATYINKKMKDTFNGGVKPVSYKLSLDGKDIDVKGPVIGEQYSGLIRERKVKKIIVTLE